MNTKKVGVLLIILFCGVLFLTTSCDTSDTYYRQNGGNELWLDEGRLLAIPDKNVIRIIDLKNRLRKEITLPEDRLPENYKLYLFEQGIVVVDKGLHNLYISENNYHVSNLTLWDWEGKQVFSSPCINAKSPETQEQFVYTTKPYWIDKNYLILNTGLQMISFDLRNETFDIFYDITEKTKTYQREAVYFETREEFCFISDSKFYFLAHNISTATGCLIKFENGQCATLFGGKQLLDFKINDKIIIVKEKSGDKEGGTFLYADKNQTDLTEIETFVFPTMEYIDNHTFAFSQYSSDKDLTYVYCFDPVQHVLQKYAMTDINRKQYGYSTPGFQCMRQIAGKPYFVFKKPGLEGDYLLYNQQGEMKALIDINIQLKNFANYTSRYSNPDCFIEYYIDENDNSIYHLRINRFSEYLI